MKGYRFSLRRRNMPTREGVLIEHEGRWTEASPLPNWSKDTLDDVIAQRPVPALQFALNCNRPLRQIVPICGLLMGDIPKEAEFLRKHDYTHAKVKVGPLKLEEALPLLRDLQQDFRLRIDFNRMWSQQDCYTLLSQLDFDYAEEPSDFTFPYALDESFREGKNRQPKYVIHKPTLNPDLPKRPFILSSAFESSIGLAHIAAIPGSEEPMGLDTWRYFEEDILEEPLYVEKGYLHFPKTLTPRKDRLVRCF